MIPFNLLPFPVQLTYKWRQSEAEPCIYIQALTWPQKQTHKTKSLLSIIIIQTTRFYHSIQDILESLRSCILLKRLGLLEPKAGAENETHETLVKVRTDRIVCTTGMDSTTTSQVLCLEYLMMIRKIQKLVPKRHPDDLGVMELMILFSFCWLSSALVRDNLRRMDLNG